MDWFPYDMYLRHKELNKDIYKDSLMTIFYYSYKTKINIKETFSWSICGTYSRG